MSGTLECHILKELKKEQGERAHYLLMHSTMSGGQTA